MAQQQRSLFLGFYVCFLVTSSLVNACTRGRCFKWTDCLGSFYDAPEPCQFEGGAGVCCDFEEDETRTDYAPIPQPRMEPNLTDELRQEVAVLEIDDFVAAATDEYRRYLKHNRDLIQQGNFPEEGSTQGMLDKYKRVDSETKRVAEMGLIFLETSKRLAKEKNLSPALSAIGLRQLDLAGTALRDSCPRESICDPEYPYRAFDGSCNNLLHPSWGQSRRGFERLLPPVYQDEYGLNHPRHLGRDGKPLPNPRVISQTLFEDRDEVYDDMTVIYMQWGQHLNHDMEATFAFGLDVSEEEGNVGISCCTPWGQIQTPLPHFACYPIEISVDDSFYSKYGQRCMNFVRSNLAPCRLGYAEQLNVATPVLDIGHIYGNDKKMADSLRTFEDGRMKSTVVRGYYELMPQCEEGVPDGCFKTGDVRYDTVPGLALLHTLHLRSHNRIAHALQQLNPHWSDERLFQEARRITIAVHQHITFNEYLSTIIGPKYLKSRGMKPFPYGNSSYRTDYDAYLNPNTFNEFSTAAFRLHSQIPGRWSLIDGKSHDYFFLRDHMLNASMLFSENNVEAQIRGMLFEEPQETDPFFSVEVTNFLFRGKEPFGLDLAALDIQRGRDHGIPPWNDLRKLCGLSPVDTWTDVAQHMGTKYVDLLRSLYSHPHDIDFWVGGTLEEERSGGALVGPTFKCIIGEQFFRKQRGDRFYYEYQSARFTPGCAPHTVPLAKVVSLMDGVPLNNYSGGHSKATSSKAMLHPGPPANPSASSHPIYFLLDTLTFLIYGW